MGILPGLGGGVIAGASIGGLTFTYIGTATSSTSSVDISSTGRLAGDIGVYFDIGLASGLPTSVTPSGHTKGPEATYNPGGVRDQRYLISAKILAGTETTITGMNTTTMRKIYAVFRPSQPVSAFAFHGNSSTATDGNPSARTIATSTETAVVVLALGQMNTYAGSISPRSTSPTMSELAGVSAVHYAHYLQRAGGSSNISYDMSDEGKNSTLQTTYLTFT